jgi:hypothetical protein
MKKFGSLRGSPEIAGCNAQNLSHMTRHMTLMRKASSLGNLSNGQAAMQQHGASEFDTALEDELMKR